MSRHLTRRAVIGSAVGALATLPLPTAAAGFSREFLEYRRLAMKHERLCLIPDPADGDATALDALCDDACDARYAARDVWFNRQPGPTLPELAWAVRADLWSLTDGKWEKHSDNDDLEEALQRAVFALVLEGGAHV
jgi:hypothetical protein